MGEEKKGVWRTINCLTVATYNEWKKLLEELEVPHKVVNESDYSGFQAKITYKES